MNVDSNGYVTTNFACPHLISAALFARQSRELESVGKVAARPASYFDETKSNVVASIFFSVASAEAWAGEIATRPQEFFPGSQSVTLARDLDELSTWSSVERKYSRLSVLAGGPPLSFKTDLQFRPIAVLVQLRNKLVHFHPEEAAARNVHVQVEQALAGLFPRSPLLDASAPMFPDAFASSGCARFAVDAARSFMESFASVRGWTVPWAKPVHAAKLIVPG